jgi:capsular polysaccharide biosynthesis protein
MHNNLDNIGTNYTERRKCMNEDEVAQMFIDQGFEEVFCENLTMEEKIGIFSSAKYVAGPIGGGMANILFCPNDTKVLSINSPLFFEVNDRLRHAMEHTQLSHFDHTQFTDKKEETVDDVGSLSISGGMNSPWEVNLNKLSKFLEAWMIY